MHVALGAHVRSSDGKDVGQIEKLIIDLKHNAVSGIVLRHGGLMHKDVQIPLSELQIGDVGELRLETYTAELIREMPAYAPLEDGGPGIESERADVAVMLAQYELEHALIHAGSAVKDNAGKKIGAVQQMEFEMPGGRLTRLVARKGLLVTEDLDVPIGLIASFGREEINLSVAADELETWTKIRDGLDVYASDEVNLGSIVQRHADHLEVSGPDGRQLLFVPLDQVVRVEEDRVLLAADSGRARLWSPPRETAPPAEPPAPMA
jgi:uncharacterized protein YrrD